VSWLAAAEAEHLSIASIEAAREDIRKFHAEMVDAARSLVNVLPTDLKALCDLTMYLEKNFTSLWNRSRSICYALCGSRCDTSRGTQARVDTMKRRRRSMRNRNRQRLAAHARRLRR
jgi:hypothetical protein